MPDEDVDVVFSKRDDVEGGRRGRLDVEPQGLPRRSRRMTPGQGRPVAAFLGRRDSDPTSFPAFHGLFQGMRPSSREATIWSVTAWWTSRYSSYSYPYVRPSRDIERARSSGGMMSIPSRSISSIISCVASRYRAPPCCLSVTSQARGPSGPAPLAPCPEKGRKFPCGRPHLPTCPPHRRPRSH